MKKIVLTFCAALLVSTGVYAQVPTITFGQNTTKLQLAWDKPTEAPTAGYDLVFANAIQTGTGVTGAQLRVIPINDPNAISFEVPVALLPAAPVNEFYVSLRARNTTGEVSGFSNNLLFRRAATPGVPANFRGVVAVVLGSLDRPASGVETAGSLIPTSGGSTHVTLDFASNSPSFSPMVASANGLGLYRLVSLGKFE